MFYLPTKVLQIFKNQNANYELLRLITIYYWLKIPYFSTAELRLKTKRVFAGEYLQPIRSPDVQNLALLL